ncbi:MAG: LUD domain-containing protein [Deltaproteobacteria bacterium]|jgi:L-lactate dehydrogenase complex protein LldF|nr:LUD domain-containing protein [Deltaproteobacteria bacterium]MBW2533469.1 LUD domain-containing protein [Deltaproteobacteria bacterium]
MKRWPLREVTRDKAADPRLGDKIHRATLHTVTQRRARVAALADWEERRDLASAARRRALDRHAELLTRLTEQLEARGVTVHHAATAAIAADTICGLVREVGTRVVKAKSMTTEEIHLNRALEQAGAEVTETDLGELIVQVAGEAPSHVTAPAIHLSIEDIARRFHDALGMPVPEWTLRGERVDEAERRALARELSLAARAHLRRRFLEADVGISGANFLVAETGTIALVENECNIQLCTMLPQRHVVVAGIDKLIEDEGDLAALLPLLPLSATAQRQSCYLSLLSDAHPDMHVVLLDGGRSRLLAQPEYRDILCCVRCGACLNACPVYRNVGGHAYGGAYAGPIGAVLLPHLDGGDRYTDLPFASSLCGACAEACPVRIPLDDHLLAMRARAVERGLAADLSLPLRAAATMMETGGRMEWGGRLYPLARRLAAHAPLASAWTQSRELPAAPRRSFRSWWRKHRARQAAPTGPAASAAPEARADPCGEAAASEPPRQGTPAPSEASSPASADLRERFAERLAELGPSGETALHRFEEADGAAAYLRERIGAESPEEVIIQGEPAPKREVALGISPAALLVADTGSVVLDLERRADGRAATLAATHVVVATPDQLVPTLAAALRERQCRRRDGAWHDVQLVVTGPSRTADVEKVLVIPAHGPRRLEVVLCDEPVDLSALRPSAEGRTEA